MEKLSKYRMITFALGLGAGVLYAVVPKQDMVGLMAGLEPAAGESVDIALHKALYNFKLVSAEPGAGINGVKGRMYFEQDATCDAWTTEHRFTTEYQYGERPSSMDVSHYVAFETKDQKQFSFSSERQENGEKSEQLRGSVERAEDGKAKAVYSRPEDLTYALPEGVLLPTMHTVEIIRHARAGDKFFKAYLFDGTDADGPVEVGTFIGKKATPEEIRKITETNTRVDASLLTSEAWHIRMAVFPLKNAAESAPSYEMEMLMHDNGVASYALVDYKTFAVEQSLAALEKLPSKKCD